MNELEGLNSSSRAMAEALMSGAAAPRRGYLTALQNVARGYRAPKRSVRIREDRSIVLYKGLGRDRPKHDGLKDRIRLLKQDCPERNKLMISYYQKELDARRAGNPTKEFIV